MKVPKNKRALILGPNNNGLSELHRLVAQSNWEFVSTGPTATHLTRLGIPHMLLPPEDYPCLVGENSLPDPKLILALMARREDIKEGASLDAWKIKPFDLAIINVRNIKEIDPKNLARDMAMANLIHAAASNVEYVTVLVDNGDFKDVFGKIISEGVAPLSLRLKLSRKALQWVAGHYRGLVNTVDYLERQEVLVGAK